MHPCPVGTLHRTVARPPDTPLPHEPDCGGAPPNSGTIALVAQRLRGALDTAETLHLDPIDVHVCELRQLARWRILPRPEDAQQYLQPWTIDDADPVFPVAVAELRWMLAQLEKLDPPAQRPPRTVPAPCRRTFA